MPALQQRGAGPITSGEIWTTYKRAVPPVLVAAMLYFGALPALWPRPTAGMRMPAEVALGDDVTLQVAATAWHSNFNVTRIRFWVDPLRSSALVEGVPFYPIELREVAPRTSWPAWSLNRFTWRRTRHYTVTAPLGRRWREGALKAGTIEGMLWVTIESPQVGRSRRYTRGGSQVNSDPHGIPFTLRLTATQGQQ
jgi:hypothetical protein